MTGRTADAGTALVEALVATAIIAAMAGLWFATIAGDTARQRMIADRRVALMIARSRLATAGVLVPLVPGTTGGRDTGYDWTIGVERDGGLALVTVTVTDARGATLATLRTARFGG